MWELTDALKYSYTIKKNPHMDSRPVRNVLPRWKGGTDMFMVIVSTLGGILKAVMVVLVIAACIKYLRQK